MFDLDETALAYINNSLLLILLLFYANIFTCTMSQFSHQPCEIVVILMSILHMGKLRFEVVTMTFLRSDN